VAARLNLPLAPVLAARLCPLPGPLYTVLMGYKESPVDEARRRFTGSVLRFAAAFLAGHGDCVRRAIGGGPDLVLPVPSSTRPGRSSLERVGGLAELVGSEVGGRWVPTVLQRAGGAVGHMRPNARAFAVDPEARAAVVNARILLLDDTYVSGSRAQSAAAALRLAGAGPVVIAPLGRVLRPDRVAAHAAFLAGRPGEAGHRSRCVSAQADSGSR
jgi:hypothetical protein